MATDQEIRDSGLLYVPKQKYLQDPFNLSTPPPSPPPASGGIVNTNAFNNTGNDDFNPAGNAFGYGSPVSEVNVRTFNPQSNDPTEKIANAQTMYNKAFQDINDPRPSAKGLNARTQTLTQTRPSQEVMDYYGEQIMNNKEQYGAQGQYNSPYDDTVDLGYKGRDTSTSIQRNRGTLGKAIDFVTDFIPGVGAVKRGAKFIKGMLPDNPNGPGGGTYGIGGLSDDKKAAYNALAGQGYLFDGEQGFKTLTGKNFQATNYVPNQLEMYEKLKDKKELTGFEKKQLLEASAIYKATQAQKQKQKEEFNKPGGTGEQVKKIQEGIDNTPYNQDANIAGGGGGNTATHDYGTGQGQQTAQEAAHDNDSNTGSAQGHNQHYARGGRAGYFFGGRVNYKAGGRISFQGGGSDASSDDFGTSTSAPGPGDTGGEGGNNPSDGSDTQFDGGNNNSGNDNNPPVTFYDNGVKVVKNRSKLGFDYPTGLTKNLSIGQLTAILDAQKSLKEEDLEGKIQYDSSIGPINTTTTYDTTTGPEFNASYTNNNLNANYNTKTGINVNYSKDIGPGTFTAGGSYDPITGEYSAEGKYGISFANGGLASIL